MPRYFFHSTHRDVSEDHHGRELVDLDTARYTAARRLGTLLHDPMLSPFDADLSVHVTDDTGMTMFMLTVMITEAPASGR